VTAGPSITEASSSAGPNIYPDTAAAPSGPPSLPARPSLTSPSFVKPISHKKRQIIEGTIKKFNKKYNIEININK
jgi:hypothetical protein